MGSYVFERWSVKMLGTVPYVLGVSGVNVEKRAICAIKTNTRLQS